ncbi:MAG: hypothetical protein JXR88_02035 [Clostridia bacterium]|nr:hypothetical protein [Clostridia bacterium]
MKKLLVLILTVFFLVGCNQKIEDYMSVEGLGLKGDVVSIKGELTSAFSGKVESMEYFDMNMKIVPNYEIKFENGLLKSTNELLPSGLSITTKDYVYNNGNIDLIEMYYEGYGGDDHVTMDFDLDDKGNINLVDDTQKVSFLVDGKKVGSSYHVKFKEGERVNIEQFNNGEGIVLDEEYQFENGKLSQYKVTFEHKEFVITFKYQNDVMIEMVKSYSGVEEIYTFDYEYDETGNWIKQNIYFNNELKYILNRDIQYK